MPVPHKRMRIIDLDAFVLRRKELGSQRTVAEAAGCSHQYLGELETGVKATCSRAIALGIARAFGGGVDRWFVRASQVTLTDVGAADREVS